jgi:Dynamin family
MSVPSRLRARERLDAILARPLTISILGEARSGKTTLLNALLGVQIIPSAEVGLVRPIFHVRYGEKVETYSVRADGSRQILTSKAFEQIAAGQSPFSEEDRKVIYRARDTQPSPLAAWPVVDTKVTEICFPLEILRDVEFIEMPASLDVLENPYLRSLARADIAIWTTTAYQAWKSSELTAWKDFRLVRRDRSFLVATQIDALAIQQDRQRLISRIDRETEGLFTARFLVSAKQVVEAIGKPEYAAILESSGIVPLGRAIWELLLARRSERLERSSRILERISRRNPETVR